jgi:hypothetical protein
LDESSTAWSTPAPWDSRTTHTMMVARPSLRKTPSGWWVSSEHLPRDSPYGLWYIAIKPDIYIYREREIRLYYIILFYIILYYIYIILYYISYYIILYFILISTC